MVEDEPAVRKILCRHLQDAGHRVQEVATGDDAYSLLLGGYRPDLVLTDVVMPGALQGPSLAAQARQLDDSIRFIFVSGYANDSGAQRSTIPLGATQLMKPISRAQLLEAVTQELSPNGEDRLS